jgi:hypothetical protein
VLRARRADATLKHAFAHLRVSILLLIVRGAQAQGRGFPSQNIFSKLQSRSKAPRSIRWLEEILTKYVKGYWRVEPKRFLPTGWPGVAKRQQRERGTTQA